MTKKTKILIHYTHKETLGHTTRINALCHELAKQPTADVYVLQGGLPQPFIRFPSSVKLLQIPRPFDSRKSFKDFYTPKQSIIRASFVIKMAHQIKPDIFITEFFPFGREEYLPELLPALRYLSKIKTRIFASIGYPHIFDLSGKQRSRLRALFPAIMPFYEKLFIHTPDSLENPFFAASLKSKNYHNIYNNFLANISDKIIYTGYILPCATPASSNIHKLMSKSDNTYNIVISRGGGAVFPKIISHAIQTQSILGPRYRFIIASGPATTDAERSLFQACLSKNRSKNITFFEHLPELAYCLEHCNASVSLCGYNTSVQLLAFQTPSIIIPYYKQRSREMTSDQRARSLLLKHHLKSTVLSYDDMTPDSLAEAIKKKCEAYAPKYNIPSEWFNGAATTAKLLLSKDQR